jgi:hypothetical protein
MGFLEEVRKTAKKRIIYTEHAVDEMNTEEEIISTKEVSQVIFQGEVIEDYPEDKKGHSCLIFAMTDKGRPVHVICSPKEEYLGIIPAYVPTEDKWEKTFKTRKRGEDR